MDEDAGFRRRRFGIAPHLDLCQLPQHELKPVELMGDLRRQSRWQGPTVPRDQLRQARAAIRPQRLIVVNPLRGAQPLDPVDEANALLQQRGALAARTTGILLVRRRWADHGADLRLAAGPGHQRPQQSLGIQAVRFGPPGPAVDLQRTRALTTHGSTPCASRRRCSQNPSRPAS